MTVYSIDILSSQSGTGPSFHVQFYLLLLDLHANFLVGTLGSDIPILKNFPQFVVIHRVKSFCIVNKSEVDVFLELSCFFDDPVDVGNLISVSSAFSEISLNVWKFTVHIWL